ncbi:acyl-CoA dehydrogenase family protein [Desertimonas flava]|jgi:alkylation response protein AidB-like acyl-CoA dehydrogenase|uniref:acyl-CoA dehydrogenase family protein n=1 Tax=Desertimonas flava TaxID=2064846 RepID=UPI000E3501CA|nr:acyl-CoA dehydrogenase family protein [Desertimonas flava]
MATEMVDATGYFDEEAEVWHPVDDVPPLDLAAAPWNELSPSEQELVVKARQISHEELAPWAAVWDEEERFPDRSYDVLREAGLLGLTVPSEFGGGGLGVIAGCLVVEQLARSCVSSAMIAQAFLNGPWRAVYVLGTPDQHERYLPGVAAGTRHFAIAMSEPGAGSAGTDLRAELRPDGDGFRLYGAKCWVTGGREADTTVVFCRAPGTHGPRGIGAVLVNRGAEGAAEPVVDPKMGFRGVAEATLRYDGVHIPAADVLVPPDPQSKRGAEILVNQFNPERCGNAAMTTGIGQAALDAAVAHVRRRRQFGRSLSEFQGIQWMLADMALDVETSRLLTWRAARSTDASGFPEQRATVMAKLHSSEMVQRVTNQAIQLHGARGYSRRWPLERYFRDARGLTMGGGTSQIMRNLLGGIVLGERHSQRGRVK